MLDLKLLNTRMEESRVRHPYRDLTDEEMDFIERRRLETRVAELSEKKMLLESEGLSESTLRLLSEYGYEHIVVQNPRRPDIHHRAFERFNDAGHADVLIETWRNRHPDKPERWTAYFFDEFGETRQILEDYMLWCGAACKNTEPTAAGKFQTADEDGGKMLTNVMAAPIMVMGASYANTTCSLKIIMFATALGIAAGGIDHARRLYRSVRQCTKNTYDDTILHISLNRLSDLKCGFGENAVKKALYFSEPEKDYRYDNMTEAA